MDKKLDNKVILNPGVPKIGTPEFKEYLQQQRENHRQKIKVTTKGKEALNGWIKS